MPAPERAAHVLAENKPNPDPSLLTTASINGMAEQLRREMASVRELLETRLDGMDTAVVIFNDNLTRVPTDTDKQISHLKELHDEKFESIAKQFAERDTRTEQTSRDSKVAVDAALQAAKEAVGEQNKSNASAIAKSEAAFTKQIDQLGTLIGSMTNGLNDKIDDLKSRQTILESRRDGQTETKNDGRTIATIIIAALTLGVAMISAIVIRYH